MPKDNNLKYMYYLCRPNIIIQEFWSTNHITFNLI